MSGCGPSSRASPATPAISAVPPPGPLVPQQTRAQWSRGSRMCQGRPGVLYAAVPLGALGRPPS